MCMRGGVSRGGSTADMDMINYACIKLKVGIPAMKILVASVLGLSLALPAAAMAGSVENMLGAGVGGAVGALVGDEVGGKTGSIVGAGVGAAAGAALTHDGDRERVVVREKVYYGGHPSDNGLHRGHHKHRHHHDD